MFQGSITALITPFHLDQTIDFESLEKLVLWHLESGTDGFILCGTTGESATLTAAEKLKVLQFVKNIVKSEKPIIFNSGTNNTKETFELTREAKALKADACLVVVPYYNKPTFEGIKQHLEYVSKAQIPIVLYHHPGRTGITLSVAEILDISKIPYISAVKETHQNLKHIKALIEQSTIPILSGDDFLTFQFMEYGSRGTISAFANVAPKAWARWIRCFETDRNKAKTIFEASKELMSAVFLETNPQGIKFALNELGFCKDVLRLPMTSCSLETRLKIKNAIQAIDETRKVTGKV